MTITLRGFGPLLLALTALAASLGGAGCATDRLESLPPGGVNLTGEWKFNPNLSDDPDKLMQQDKTPAHDPGTSGRHGGRAGHGGGPGGGGIPPYDSGATGNNWSSAGKLVRVSSGDLEQATPLPAVGTLPPAAPTNATPGSLGRLLQAPDRLSIAQNGVRIAIRTNMPDGTVTADEYVSGTKHTVTLGEKTAEVEAGWRGLVYVVTTSYQHGGWREDDYGLDEDGRLIVTTLMKGGRMGKVEIKRVYDRIRS